MIAVVLTVLAAWLLLSVLVTALCALVTRGGLTEDGRRGRLDAELTRMLDAADSERPAVPRPRAGVG